jgi:hypothetical protein
MGFQQILATCAAVLELPIDIIMYNLYELLTSCNSPQTLLYRDKVNHCDQEQERPVSRYTTIVEVEDIYFNLAFIIQVATPLNPIRYDVKVYH